MPHYDQWGWATDTVLSGRFTDIPVPTNIPEGQAANWTGHAWVVLPYSAPPPTPEPILQTKLTKLAFRNRFTQAEKVAIEIAALDVPAASMPQRTLAASLRASQQDLSVAQYIDTARVDTRAGVQQLESVGLLAAGRALEILDAPIEDHERFTG